MITAGTSGEIGKKTVKRATCTYKRKPCTNYSVCSCGECALHCKHPEDPRLMSIFITASLLTKRNGDIESKLVSGEIRTLGRVNRRQGYM